MIKVLTAKDVIELIKRYAGAAANAGVSHARLHTITSTADHSSIATDGRILVADANGLPVEGIIPDTDAAIVRDPVPVVDSMLVKNASLTLKEYSPLFVGFGLEIVTDEGGNKIIQLSQSPAAPLGRRLMSPLGAPFSQGVIP
jgi:hypothetical protein